MVIDLTKNKRWVKRIGQYFDSMDLNKNGYLTIDEFMEWAENMRVMCKASDSEMTEMKDQLQIFWGTVGLKSGIQMTKEEFIQAVNRLARDELDRQKRGVKTLLEQMHKAFFDVMDINNDGTVSLDELKTVMKACKMDPNGAESWFSAADYNKDGRVESKELSKVQFEFWFHPEKEEVSTLFGGAYSGD